MRGCSGGRGGRREIFFLFGINILRISAAGIAHRAECRTCDFGAGIVKETMYERYQCFIDMTLMSFVAIFPYAPAVISTVSSRQGLIAILTPQSYERGKQLHQGNCQQTPHDSTWILQQLIS